MYATTARCPETAQISVGRKATLWSLFFLICMGLGYPTLNRYDPRSVTGLYDTRAYYSLVTGTPLQGDQSDLAHRVLVPFVAKPIYLLANGHLHTWDPVLFALLVANSFFIATTAYLLVVISQQVTGDYAVALIGGFIYLANFAVANFNLSGYVDSAVNCVMIAIVWTLLTERWWLLPLWGILGALAKETFVPLSVVFAFAWWLTARRRGTLRISRLAWIGTMAVVGLATVTLLMSRAAHPYTPWSFAGSRAAVRGAGLFFFSGLVRCLAAREFIYVFAWLLPLGLLRIARLPRMWVVGSAWAAFAALAMGAYDDALGNATRAIFSACGPVLSLSVALLLVDAAHVAHSPENPVN
jgi:hypothetical protein